MISRFNNLKFSLYRNIIIFLIIFSYLIFYLLFGSKGFFQLTKLNNILESKIEKKELLIENLDKKKKYISSLKLDNLDIDNLEYEFKKRGLFSNKEVVIDYRN